MKHETGCRAELRIPHSWAMKGQHRSCVLKIQPVESSLRPRHGGKRYDSLARGASPADAAAPTAAGQGREVIFDWRSSQTGSHYFTVLHRF